MFNTIFMCTGKKRRKGTTVGKSQTKTPRKSGDPSEASTSTPTKEIIWQKESDRQKLESNKLKAIELLKNSRGRGKRPVKRVAQNQPPVHLSESDSN